MTHQLGHQRLAGNPGRAGRTPLGHRRRPGRSARTLLHAGPAQPGRTDANSQTPATRRTPQRYSPPAASSPPFSSVRKEVKKRRASTSASASSSGPFRMVSQ